MKHTLKATAGAALLVLSSGSHALNFNIVFSPGTTAQQVTAFNQAAGMWSGLLADNVTVNLNLGTANLPAGVLAQAGSVQLNYSFSTFRSALSADATSAVDTQAVSSLPTGTNFGMLINRTSDNPNGLNSATPYLSTSGANTNTVSLTSANAKALGLNVAGVTTDAQILFGAGFSYDYNRNDGISADQFDFVGLAVHEIGHALGFISGVDVLDTNIGFAAGAYQEVTSLDLFRYSALSTTQTAFGKAGVLDFSADTRSKYFSLDNGATVGPLFATGMTFGDGRQASHWKDNLGLGVLDPTAGYGELLTVSSHDLKALDAVGWNLAVAVPEPGTWVLFGLGLAGLGLHRRRALA